MSITYKKAVTTLNKLPSGEEVYTTVHQSFTIEFSPWSLLTYFK